MGINLKLMIDSDLTYCVYFILDMNNDTIIAFIIRIKLEKYSIYNTRCISLFDYPMRENR